MDHHRAVLVGLGDFEDGTPELDWAAREAQQRRTRLHVVRAYHLAQKMLPWDNYTDRAISAELRSDAQNRVHTAVRYVNEQWPDVEVHAGVVDRTASAVLIEGSRDAAVTVLGTRQLGLVEAAFLGSVSTVVAAAGSGPIVLVGKPGGMPAEQPGVVVGVDGSDTTDDVVGYAFEHASRHRLPLHAIFCYSPDLLATSKWRPPQPPPKRADRWLAEALAGWQEKYPDVEVHRGIVRGHPGSALVEAAMGQELLVVGSHSEHARIAALLGSVSQAVLHHATCPVAVVHPRQAVTRLVAGGQ